MIKLRNANKKHRRSLRHHRRASLCIRRATSAPALPEPELLPPSSSPIEAFGPSRAGSSSPKLAKVGPSSPLAYCLRRDVDSDRFNPTLTHQKVCRGLPILLLPLVLAAGDRFRQNPAGNPRAPLAKDPIARTKLILGSSVQDSRG